MNESGCYGQVPMVKSTPTIANLTHRQWLAAHAPHEPASWFKPNMPPKPDSKWMDLAGNVYPTAGAAETSAGYRAFHNANLEAIQAWERQWLIACTAQWPWSWADAVLAAENGGGV